MYRLMRPHSLLFFILVSTIECSRGKYTYDTQCDLSTNGKYVIDKLLVSHNLDTIELSPCIFTSINVTAYHCIDATAINKITIITDYRKQECQNTNSCLLEKKPYTDSIKKSFIKFDLGNNMCDITIEYNVDVTSDDTNLDYKILYFKIVQFLPLILFISSLAVSIFNFVPGMI